MKRIIADRGMGKTESLFSYAESLAARYPDKKIYFVALTDHSAKMLYNRHPNAPKNLVFTCHNFLNSKLQGVKNDDYYLVVDELDCFLRRFNVTGYSVTMEEKI